VQEDAALTEMDATFADPDAIGWAYQFYQDEAKAQVYARLKAGKKVTTRDDISAATQLFTEPYMVQWLLQNSLGRSYHEAYPHSALPATWAYYMRPKRLDVPAFSTLESLTLLDPCVGSGHFVREAFDMFVAMYREQHPRLTATEIADLILERHLYGIDIDPRAAQLAAFTLYARAWELVRDERRTQRRPGSGSYMPKAMNLAASPERIAPGALARHLQRHPEDRLLEPLLKGVFAALERADMLGSLLRPREHLQTAITELRKPHNLRLGTVEEQDLQAAIETVAHTDPAHLEEMLLDRVAAGFAAEARDPGDVTAALFGRAAERGVRLLQLLDRQYAVVVTNPPYMGSKNMDSLLRGYVERHYTPGKRDLYAAFILRCLELVGISGRVAMVTQQSWMFLGSYVALRAVPQEELARVRERGAFTGLLRESRLETLAHLGPNAFEEISGEVVQSALFVTARGDAGPEHRLTALRLVGLRSPREKANGMQRRSNPSQVLTADLLLLPQSPIAYWVPQEALELLASHLAVQSVADVRQGIGCADVTRLVRQVGEVGEAQLRNGWSPYVRGGGYSKWYGLVETYIDWRSQGARVKSTKSIVPSEHRYFTTGLTYTDVAGGSLSVRILPKSAIFSDGSPGIFANSEDGYLSLMAVLNSRIVTYLLRITSPSSMHFRMGYVARLPMPELGGKLLENSARNCVTVKKITSSENLGDVAFLNVGRTSPSNIAILLSLEAYMEDAAKALYHLGNDVMQAICRETGTPVGWYPLIAPYDTLPKPSDGVTLPDEVIAYLAAHPRRSLKPGELDWTRGRLRALYEAGPGGSVIEDTGDERGDSEDEGEAEVSGAYLPIPPETFLEVLSQKLEIHPISTYWLLQEICAEGTRCKPEERRLLEDRLSVIVVRLLGHRWPKQLESDEPVPDWADQDGIISLLPGSGEASLADWVRERLRAEDGDLGVQQTEALLTELTGQNLDAWLRRSFFPRHVRQFKYRPIAWHLASVPVGGLGGGRGKGGLRQVPTFECMVYYHACGLGLLARLRTQYVAPLLHAERGRVASARQSGDDTAAAHATVRVQELEAFMETLRGVEEQGFDTPQLEDGFLGEPLDRWSGDGILAPASRDALLAQERAWAVNINDGVRVNIAPLQLAGVLAADVLKDADAKKALADRVRWRADERRWVREGTLPRCGWMAEDIPASPRWIERAPEREVEQRKLERKRAEARAHLEPDGGAA